MRNTANIITSMRIPLALALLFVPPLSVAFWVCYVACALSDILDGAVARGLHQQSDLGARLDSAADLVFAAVIAVILIVNVSVPTWLWVWGVCIALLRVSGYGIGYCKYHCFSALHTCANKASGGLIFLFPLLYRTLGIETGGILLCAVASFAAVEELLITARSKELDRDRKSILNSNRTKLGQ